MMKNYTPLNWYWLDDAGKRVYASARQTIVSTDDTDYKAFIADGTKPTAWPRDASGKVSDAEMRAVLAPYGLMLSLDDLKAQLKARVDAKAEEVRLTLITPGSGQAMEYQEAYAQAQAALAATGTVKDTDYPMLAATVGIDTDPQTGKAAKDVLGVARSVKAAYEAFLTAGAAIRGARLGGKAAIQAAGNAADAQSACDAISWPTFN